MESIEEIRKHYKFGHLDEQNLVKLGEILLPLSDQLADDFYHHLMEFPYTASFLRTEQAVKHRKETMKEWFREVFSSRYDHKYLLRLQKVGQVHVRIGLKGHHVNAAMNFIRNFCVPHVINGVSDPGQQEVLLETLGKALDINLDVMTGSYREAELQKVFLSHRVEYWLVRWAERVLHGLNLLLMLGLVVMALGVVGLLVSDILYALNKDLEHGVVKALGSVLVLWMMIELIHAQVEHLRGGRFSVVVFVELAMVAFIRKVFVASIEPKDPMTYALLLGGLLVLGTILFFVTRGLARPGR